jgi:hypothetical protein
MAPYSRINMARQFNKWHRAPSRCRVSSIRSDAV